MTDMKYDSIMSFQDLVVFGHENSSLVSNAANALSGTVVALLICDMLEKKKTKNMLSTMLEDQYTGFSFIRDIMKRDLLSSDELFEEIRSKNIFIHFAISVSAATGFPMDRITSIIQPYLFQRMEK